MSTAALYSPATGFNKSAIMSRALASARESRAWQIKFAASPNGIKEGAKPQGWRFLMSHALKSAWTFARAERAQHDPSPTSAAHAWLLASLATDGRIAA
jgi:hypothetical protein